MGSHGEYLLNPLTVGVGMDVARKVVILARECGLSAELESLQVDSLVPAALSSLSDVDEVMSRLPEVCGGIHSQP